LKVRLSMDQGRSRGLVPLLGPYHYLLRLLRLVASSNLPSRPWPLPRECPQFTNVASQVGLCPENTAVAKHCVYRCPGHHKAGHPMSESRLAGGFSQRAELLMLSLDSCTKTSPFWAKTCNPGLVAGTENSCMKSQRSDCGLTFC
jgi:hypothetical protein